MKNSVLKSSYSFIYVIKYLHCTSKNTLFEYIEYSRFSHVSHATIQSSRYASLGPAYRWEGFTLECRDMKSRILECQQKFNRGTGVNRRSRNDKYAKIFLPRVRWSKGKFYEIKLCVATGIDQGPKCLPIWCRETKNGMLVKSQGLLWYMLFVKWRTN